LNVQLQKARERHPTVPLFAFLRTVRGLRVLPIGFLSTDWPRDGDGAEVIIDALEGLKLDFLKVDGKGSFGRSSAR
jgi:hypothetical protein